MTQYKRGKFVKIKYTVGIYMLIRVEQLNALAQEMLIELGSPISHLWNRSPPRGVALVCLFGNYLIQGMTVFLTSFEKLCNFCSQLYI